MKPPRKQRSDMGQPRKPKDEQVASANPPTSVPKAEIEPEVVEQPSAGAPEGEARRLIQVSDRYSTGTITAEARSLSNHELTGLSQEAWEAYDMQDVRVRFDSKGFKWWFGVVTDTGNSELKLQRSAPVGDFHVQFISTRDLGRDVARQLVDDAVRSLA